MKAEKERDVMRAVRKFLELSGYLVIRLNAGAAMRGKSMIRLAEAGTADLLALGVDQPALLVEVKGPDGKLRDSQKAFADLVRQKGHNWCCVKSVAEMQAILEQINA